MDKTKWKSWLLLFGKFWLIVFSVLLFLAVYGVILIGISSINENLAIISVFPLLLIMVLIFHFILNRYFLKNITFEEYKKAAKESIKIIGEEIGRFFLNIGSCILYLLIALVVIGGVILVSYGMISLLSGLSITTVLLVIIIFILIFK